MAQKKGVDPKLDRMLGRKVKCPYCRMRIEKYAMTCTGCGITKEQICYASNADAKEIIKGRKEGKVLYTRVRPDDIHLGKFFLVLATLGLFGGHNFYVGRRKRGFFMLGAMLICIAFLVIFPSTTYVTHPARVPFETSFFPFFPTDVLGVIAFCMWIYDWFAIVVFSSFRYPVRINRKEKLNSRTLGDIIKPCSKNMGSSKSSKKKKKHQR